MVPLYMLTGKKCNFCTYIVSGAPNGPSIQGDLGKVQFLHLKGGEKITRIFKKRKWLWRENRLS